MGKKNKGTPQSASVQGQATVTTVSRNDSAQVVNAKDLIARLSQSAVLMSVKVHLWSGTKSAPHLKSALVSATKGEEDGFNSPTLVIIPPEVRTPLTGKANEAKKFFEANSVPYGEKRLRLVPTAILAQVRQEIEKYNVELRNMGDEVALKRDTVIVPWAKKVLGEAFKEDDIPNATQLRGKCFIEMEFSTMSTPPTMEGDESGKLREEIEQSMAKQYVEGLKTVVVGVRDQLLAAAEALGSEDQKKVRYGSLVQNFIRAMKRLYKLNIGDSPEVQKLIDRACAAIQDVSDLDTDGKLKTATDEGKKVREDAGKKVKEAVTALDSFTL